MLKKLVLMLLIFEAKGGRHKRVYNGAVDLNVPYFVQIFNDEKSGFCGGAIIASNWILTAAHCLNGKSKDSLTVIIGSKQKRLEGEPHKVADIIVHEKYNPSKFEHDIGLIKLQEFLELNDERQLIRIRSTSLNENDTSVKVSGMGALNTARSYPEFTMSNVLPLVDSKTCQSTYYSSSVYSEITKNMFCAGSKDNHICLGDSGGPAVDPNSGRLVGIVSWGQYGRACSDGPDVYTNVISYREWIEQNTCAHFENIPNHVHWVCHTRPDDDTSIIN